MLICPCCVHLSFFTRDSVIGLIVPLQFMWDLFFFQINAFHSIKILFLYMLCAPPSLIFFAYHIFTHHVQTMTIRSLFMWHQLHLRPAQSFSVNIFNTLVRKIFKENFKQIYFLALKKDTFSNLIKFFGARYALLSSFKM